MAVVGIPVLDIVAARHTLFTQLAPVAQAIPQPPQLFESLTVFTQ